LRVLIAARPGSRRGAGTPADFSRTLAPVCPRPRLSTRLLWPLRRRLACGCCTAVWKDGGTPGPWEEGRFGPARGGGRLRGRTSPKGRSGADACRRVPDAAHRLPVRRVRRHGVGGRYHRAETKGVTVAGGDGRRTRTATGADREGPERVRCWVFGGAQPTGRRPPACRTRSRVVLKGWLRFRARKTLCSRRRKQGGTAVGCRDRVAPR